MSVVVTEAPRIFKMGVVTLADFDPTLPPDEIRKRYARSYPHLNYANIEGPTFNAKGEAEFAFVAPSGKYKGSACRGTR